MIYLNEDIETLDVRSALAAVSEQRRQKVQQYRQIHDQRQSLTVYLLLCEALEKEYGIIEQPEFSYSAHGKPYSSPIFTPSRSYFPPFQKHYFTYIFFTYCRFTYNN